MGLECFYSHFVPIFRFSHAESLADVFELFEIRLRQYRQDLYFSHHCATRVRYDLISAIILNQNGTQQFAKLIAQVAKYEFDTTPMHDKRNYHIAGASRKIQKNRLRWQIDEH
jgi:hypothetical protein